MKKTALNDFIDKQLDTVHRTDNPPSILFLIPAHNSTVTAPLLESLLEFSLFATNLGIAFNWIIDPYATIISLCRSQLISMADEIDDWTHVLFVDNDMGFEPLDVMRLVVADQDIVAGVAPVKSYPLAENNATNNVLEENDWGYKVLYTGTGFMMIKRHVVSEMMDHYRHALAFEMPDGNYYEQTRVEYVDLFDTITSGANEQDKRVYLTEDYAFCHRARECGFEVWSHKHVKLTHTGMHTFSFNGEQDMLERYQLKGDIKVL